MSPRRKNRNPRAARARRPRLASAWGETRRALRSAEATVGRRVSKLVERSGLEPKAVRRTAELWRARIEREGKKARKRVEAGLVELRQRARHDRRTLVRSVDDAVARALGVLNIPTRHEVQQLSRRVEQLARRIGALR